MALIRTCAVIDKGMKYAEPLKTTSSDAIAALSQRMSSVAVGSVRTPKTFFFVPPLFFFSENNCYVAK